MSPEQRDQVVFRILAAWPRPPIPDSTLVVWHEHLSPLDFDRAMKAVKVLEVESRHQPRLADFHDAYDVQHGAKRAVSAPDCGVCGGTGWVDRGSNTVTKCPQGCKVPTADEWAAKRAREDWQYDQRRARERKTAGVGARPIDFTEPGSRSEPDEEPF